MIFLRFLKVKYSDQLGALRAASTTSKSHPHKFRIAHHLRSFAAYSPSCCSSLDPNLKSWQVRSLWLILVRATLFEICLTHGVRAALTRSLLWFGPSSKCHEFLTSELFGAAIPPTTSCAAPY